MFRDETDLTLNPDLWGMISSRLDRTAYLVLLMCPESAASPWVNKEVAHWCDTHGVDHVLMVWTGGALEWDDTGGDFSRESSAVADVMDRSRQHRRPAVDGPARGSSPYSGRGDTGRGCVRRAVQHRRLRRPDHRLDLLLRTRRDHRRRDQSEETSACIASEGVAHRGDRRLRAVGHRHGGVERRLSD